VAGDESGDFLVVWDAEEGDSNNTYAQAFDSSRGKLGTQFRVNTSTVGEERHLPAVASAGKGNFIVVWESQYQISQDGDDVFGQRLHVEFGGVPHCGDLVDPPATRIPGSETGLITATDALEVLKSSVGLRMCPLCICDVNGSGSITVTDALQVLQRATGSPVDLNRPSCE
jgi:hypothetical protein